MCGIAGGSGPRAAADARSALARLAHRGPGERRVVERGDAALGLARLHVVAPGAPSGPYVTDDGAAAAAVNGEIWNHDEIRASLRARGVAVPDAPDTAVVAPLFRADGVAGLARLRGMFAAAIHDARDGSLVLARDRFGIKPLFWSPGADVRFASEPSALRSCGAPDRAVVADMLALGVVPAPSAWRSGVRQVEPGTAVVVAGASHRTERFAPLPRVGDGGAASPAALRAALERSVRRHRMGDLPLAVLVSGGVDSAIVAALAASAAREAGGPPPHLVTLSIPGEGAYDEVAGARELAAHLGLPLHEATLRADDVPELLDRVVAAHGGPFADASALATHALCAAAAQHAGIVLSGTGADELCAGYRRYRLDRVPRAAAAAARVAAAVLPTSRRTRLGTWGALARKAARAVSADPAERYLEALAVVPAPWRARLLGDATPPPALARVRAAFDGAPSFADAARAADLALYLPDDVLAKEDRAAAAASIENRVPFLDDEVATLAAACPASAHLRSGGERGPKAALREAFRGVLPEPVRNRPKRGFGVPISEWMRGPLRTLADSRLGAGLGGLVDPDAVRALAAAHRAGDDDLGPAVWTLVVVATALAAETRP